MASTTSICNMALARIGAKRISDYDDSTDTKPEAIYCRLYYEQAAKALQRSHLWRFARHRVQLSLDTTDPVFEWTYAYLLPNDFLRLIAVYDGSDFPDGRTYESFELEGARLLIEEDTVYLKYIRWMSDVTTWDPLFTEVMVLSLAKKLVIPLSQDTDIKADIDKDLEILSRRVRAMDRNEAENIGRTDLKTWNDARCTDIA